MTLVERITTTGQLVLSGGSLAVASLSSLGGPFVMSGGVWAGPGDVVVGNGFVWSNGTIAGSGDWIVPAGVTWTFGGDAPAAPVLDRTLGNWGACQVVGNGEISVPGRFLNHSGGTLTLLGSG
jgi:hypothetical protein